MQATLARAGSEKKASELARFEARFALKVRALASGCWEWRAQRTWKGYGRYRLGGRGRMVYAHRFAYEALNGPIAAGLYLDHLCRNRWCVNPAHLEAVTNFENHQRRPTVIAKRQAA